MSDFMPWYICDECGDEVDGKDITVSGYPQKFYCAQCVYEGVDRV